MKSFEITGPPTVIQHPNRCHYGMCTRGGRFDRTEFGVSTTDGFMHMVCALKCSNDARNERLRINGIADESDEGETSTQSLGTMLKAALVEIEPTRSGFKTHVGDAASLLKDGDVLIAAPVVTRHSRQMYKIWIVTP